MANIRTPSTLASLILCLLLCSPGVRAQTTEPAAAAAATPTAAALPPDQADRPETGVQRTIGEFLGHFSAYEPMYFIAGPVDPVAKWQVSFKYRLLNPKAALSEWWPPLSGLHFAYTQMALWQLDKPSAPFFDTNYQPEFFWSDEDMKKIKIPTVSQFGFQGGFGHESNGQDGADSRSINILFARPIATFGDPERFHVVVAPKFYIYIGDLSNNPDIAFYQGYCDFRTIVGWRQGLELSTVARVGSHFNRGSVQLDLTYPMRNLLFKNFDLYLDAQYFYGYGESLLTYNQRSNAFRIGLGLVR